MKYFLRTLKLGLTLKDPCKMCLVKACCSNKCEDKIYVEKLIFPYDSVKEKKMYSYIVLFLMCWAAGLPLFIVLVKLFSKVVK